MFIQKRKNDPIALCENPKCKARTAESLICPECGKGFCGQCFIGIDESGTGQVKCPHCKKRIFLPIR